MRLCTCCSVFRGIPVRGAKLWYFYVLEHFYSASRSVEVPLSPLLNDEPPLVEIGASVPIETATL